MNNKPFLWVRGDAQINGDRITIDPATNRLYAPCIDVPKEGHKFFEFASTAEPFSGSLLFDLAGLSRPVRAKDAVDFAARHGLLRHGPDADSLSESFRDWEIEASELYDLVRLYRAFRLGLTDEELSSPEREPQIEEVDSVARKTQASLSKPSNVDYLHIPERINARLMQVRPQIIAGAQLRPEWLAYWKPRRATTATRKPSSIISAARRSPNRHSVGSDYRPAIFRDVVAPDLLTYAYFEFAVVVEDQLALGQCAECSKFFILRDQRMQFCSSQCRARIHARNHYARVRGGKD